MRSKNSPVRNQKVTSKAMSALCRELSVQAMDYQSHLQKVPRTYVGLHQRDIGEFQSIIGASMYYTMPHVMPCLPLVILCIGTYIKGAIVANRTIYYYLGFLYA